MDRIVDTGTMIKTYLDGNGITIVQLADASNVSFKTVYRVLNNQTKLSYEVANGINKLIPGLTVDFLMSYDAKYRVQQKEFEKEIGISNVNYLIDKFQLKKLYPNLASNKNALIEKGKKVFNFGNDGEYRIDSLNYLVNFSTANNSKDFEKKIWLISSYSDYYDQNEKPLVFNQQAFDDVFYEVKDYCGTTNKEMTILNMNEICKMCGINFVYRPSIRNSRIKAATLRDDNGYIFIFLSDLFKCVENLWISFVHELIHIKNKDYDKEQLNYEEYIIKNEEVIEKETFEYFISKDYSSDQVYDASQIARIAKANNIPKGIAAYLIRNIMEDYKNVSINEMIHYY